PPPAARYNIAPSQPVGVVRLNNGRKEWGWTAWGLVPSWSREGGGGSGLINARGETVMEKPSFKAAFTHRRCLIPATAFYEWAKRDGVKAPWCIRRRDGDVFAFGGLWEHWQGADGSELETCAVITVEALGLMRPLHHRMPLIVAPADYALWLDPRETGRKRTDGQMAGNLGRLLTPTPWPDMEAFEVSRFVNSPRNEGAACQAPPLPGPPSPEN
ncbi:MAG: SOS response-associated peptidase, partial [Deltaproteobacteria bacterium]|nr:SOS response-associated peptidase [Deltaproteobacteria bacterium]